MGPPLCTTVVHGDQAVHPQTQWQTREVRDRVSLQANGAGTSELQKGPPRAALAAATDQQCQHHVFCSPKKKNGVATPPPHATTVRSAVCSCSIVALRFSRYSAHPSLLCVPQHFVQTHFLEPVRVQTAQLQTRLFASRETTRGRLIVGTS